MLICWFVQMYVLLDLRPVVSTFDVSVLFLFYFPNFVCFGFFFSHLFFILYWNANACCSFNTCIKLWWNWLNFTPINAAKIERERMRVANDVPHQFIEIKKKWKKYSKIEIFNAKAPWVNNNYKMNDNYVSWIWF